MERALIRSLLPLFLFLTFSLNSFSQELTGIWRGYFTTDGGEQYKLEFQIKQTNELKITGVSYSYLDIRFYGKATMIGNLTKPENKFKIQELRTVELKSIGGGSCLMNYSFKYSRSGNEEFLEGTFLGKNEDRTNPANNGKWGDCGGGTVYLRKVTTSDFYVEPFLKHERRPDTVALVKPRNTVPRTNTTSNTVVKRNPVTKPPVKNNTTTTRPRTDTSKAVVVKPVIKNPSAEIIEKKNVTVPDVLKSRENALAQAITVNTDEITIKLYDNGEVDGDTISIYVDKALVLANKRLSTSPIVLPLKFESEGDEHEVVMVAENLGRIPPNTSLMIIYAGEKQFKVQITSTEQKNAMVRFRYAKP